MALLESSRNRVFFSRQLEVWLEDEWFHWITNRAIRQLEQEGVIRGERRVLKTGGTVHLLWHRSNRYYKREATRVVRLVEEYADPNIGGALGLQGEALVLEGFARERFLMLGREMREHAGRRWVATNHDLDFVFEGDGVAYGVEVKNTLGYMEHAELLTKVRMCAHLGLRPVFAARMLPKSWIHEVVTAGGFCLVYKYQLYPWAHRDLARRVRTELQLPVDSPRALEDGTMKRFIGWHKRHGP